MNNSPLESLADKAKDVALPPLQNSEFSLQSIEPRSLAEFCFTSLLYWVPTRAGVALRRLIYPLLFEKSGASLTVEDNVKLRGISSLSFADRVSLRNNVSLAANSINSSIKLGCEVFLDNGVDIRTVAGYEGCHIIIGDKTYIGPYTCFAGPGSISVGSNCLIASHCGIYANNHNFENTEVLIRDQGVRHRGISIGDNCWLGSGVTILDGVVIGAGCVVGAGAVVTRSLPEQSIAIGVPAKVVGRRGEVDTD